MKRAVQLPLLLTAVALVWSTPAEAQMFGSRQVGGSILSKYQKAADPTATDATGSGRFVRGARSKDDFVGAGNRQTRDFVGAEGVTKAEQVRTAVSNLKVDTGPDVNKAAAAPTTTVRSMYTPRLAVGFDVARPQAPVLSSGLQGRLAVSPSIQWTSPCAVSLEGKTATLRGTVASARDRRLAELLVLLEPGIAEVQNELQIAPPGATTSSPSAPSSTNPAQQQ